MEVSMNKELKEKFLNQWEKYFNGANLPIAFYYTDEEVVPEPALPATEPCFIARLSEIMAGKALRFSANSIGCPGGKRYLGFPGAIMPNFEYFLSCGIPGKLEGERYLKTPELVTRRMSKIPQFRAPKKFIVFKRWDLLSNTDEPEVVIFFATADVLAGLYTLANFDEEETDCVIAPFGAGCATIVQYPYLERASARPRCIIGMFDPSARPFLPANVISFSVPLCKFVRMIDNMGESFLITKSWDKVRKRITKDK